MQICLVTRISTNSRRRLRRRRPAAGARFARVLAGLYFADRSDVCPRLAGAYSEPALAPYPRSDRGTDASRTSLTASFLAPSSIIVARSFWVF
jgi:hypothetical protein